MFFNKKKDFTNPVRTDIHSHLIPGVDDGSRSLEESVSLIRQLRSFGYERIFITPHVKSDIYPNDESTIFSNFEKLQSEVHANGINVELGYAAEYYIDSNFVTLLENGENLLTLPGNYVLVEMSMRQEPLFLYEVIFDLHKKGYRPVMAHPERYAFYGVEPKPYEKLKKAGCLLQLNMFSIAGHYGQQSMKIAKMLIKNNLADLVGTDLHKEDQVAMFKDKTVQKMLTGYRFRNDSLFKETN